MNVKIVLKSNMKTVEIFYDFIEVGRLKSLNNRRIVDDSNNKKSFSYKKEKLLEYKIYLGCS